GREAGRRWPRPRPRGRPARRRAERRVPNGGSARRRRGGRHRDGRARRRTAGRDVARGTTRTGSNVVAATMPCALRGRLMVGRLTLDQVVKVRVLAPQPQKTAAQAVFLLSGSR